MKPPYTRDELQKILERLRRDIKETEYRNPEVRPLPPMAEDEVKDLFEALCETATQRTLANPEAFMLGQLLSNYRMAVEARMLGRKGRYFVVSEEEISRLSQ